MRTLALHIFYLEGTNMTWSGAELQTLTFGEQSSPGSHVLCHLLISTHLLPRGNWCGLLILWDTTRNFEGRNWPSEICLLWCESTLLEDIAWRALWAVSPLSTQISVFDFFLPLQGQKMRLGNSGKDALDHFSCSVRI